MDKGSYTRLPPTRGEGEGRHICWWSDGIASAITTKFYLRDHPEALIVSCDTGSEDEDNLRFRGECVRWLNREIQVIRNEKFEDTYDVWDKRRYISGIAGAPCTSELKVWPRLQFQRPDDVHVFGYTFDRRDRDRFDAFRQNYPEYAYTPETLADLWEVSAATVRNLVRAGELRAFRIGRQIRIRPEAVTEYEGRQCQSGGSNSTAESTPPSDPTAGRRNAIRSAPPILARPSAD
jgi:excisionase family DNA binding protein